MPKKRKAFLHIGLDDGSGDFVDAALDAARRALAELGVRRPARVARGAVPRRGRDPAHPQRVGLPAPRGRGRLDRHRAPPRLKGRDTLVFSQTLLAGAARAGRSAARRAGRASRCTSSSPRTLPTPGPCPASRATTSARCSTLGGRRGQAERVHVIVADETGAAPGRRSARSSASARRPSPRARRSPTEARPAAPGSGRARAHVLHALGTLVGRAAPRHRARRGRRPRPTGATSAATGADRAVAARGRARPGAALAEIERLTRRNESARAAPRGAHARRSASSSDGSAPSPDARHRRQAQPIRGQCGCQASSSAVREVTALGSLPSASCWIETSRRRRAASGGRRSRRAGARRPSRCS